MAGRRMLMTPTTGDKMCNSIFDEHGLSSLFKTYFKFVNPGNRLIANWRAGCGKSAGSEGGEAQINALFLPLSAMARTKLFDAAVNNSVALRP